MDALLRALQLGFILRSLFAGVFFVASYRLSYGGIATLANPSAGGILTTSLPVALFVGVTAYVLHRALVYPVIEQLFNTESAVRMRLRFPLISRHSLSMLRELWLSGAESGKQCEAVIRHITIWADYTHMLYVSALCLLAGSTARYLTTPGAYELDLLLAFIVFVFVVAAVVSNWRLHVVRETVLRSLLHQQQRDET